jgi:hypothetical protein
VLPPPPLSLDFDELQPAAATSTAAAAQTALLLFKGMTKFLTFRVHGRPSDLLAQDSYGNCFLGNRSVGRSDGYEATVIASPR